MHVSDALISPGVAGVAGAIAVTLIAVASKKTQELKRPDIIPLMGVMGAFVFAAQMINFTIPGTGSSGHLIGGLLLSAILGPWCGFITLCSILMVQCLFFADGGLLALGCNILNMAATSCLIAYPFIYKPIAGNNEKPLRILIGSILASIVALEIGAFAVTVETELSGITALPFSTFITFMLPIHLAIGLVEGVVTGGLLIFLANYSPSTLQSKNEIKASVPTPKKVYWIVGIVTLVLAGGFTVLASEYPDGLEWSVEKLGGIAEESDDTPVTALMPDYDSGFAGIVGALIVMVILWGVSSFLFRRLKKSDYKA